jgi:hypothetical protein
MQIEGIEDAGIKGKKNKFDSEGGTSLFDEEIDQRNFDDDDY